MVRGDKNSAEASSTAGGTNSEEGEEIDRIMKEIEDLEKKMDVPESTAAAEAHAAAEGDEEGKVVALRPSASEPTESMAETDAVPASDEPLMRDASPAGDGGLSMKIGGCSEVSLEFTQAGMTVSLSCSNEGLCITTDQGAEFRIPFKRAA